MPGHDDKASRYVALLDAARVHGTWSEIPELVRKVKKHALSRKFLVCIAEAEQHVATNLSKSFSGSETSSTPLQSLSNSIASAADEDEEELLQAKVCLLWAAWVATPEQAVDVASDLGFADSLRKLKGTNTSTWTKICIVKGAYIEGTARQDSKQVHEARNLFTQAADLIQANRDLVLSTPQLLYWSEQLLAQLALISPGNDSVQSEALAISHLQVFRRWLAVVSKTAEINATKYGNSAAHLSRILIWRRYYQQLSSLLKLEAAGQISTSPEDRQQTANELRKVETLYENELLRVHKFPQATGSNAAVEEWVEQVIANWWILCSSVWRDHELGEGGRQVLSRNVLDILYRAASKTFHSTLILRRLFQVHKSVADFDLAYRALDTYIDLVERSKDRAEKSTTPSPDIESTEQFLLTISEGIEGLCKFGGQSQAQRAHHLCVKLQKWLEKVGFAQGSAPRLNGDAPGPQTESKPGSVLSRYGLEVVHRALGTGTANWARSTPFSEDRTQLHETAVSYLRKACAQSAGYQVRVETYYAAALVLAETREITEAIRLAKHALDQATKADTGSGRWPATLHTVSIWHLLALLLSSKEDFDSAAKSCAAAFEQFPSSELLAGIGHKTSNTTEEKGDQVAPIGLFKDVECEVLQRIIDIRITELALTELKDGPEGAVNCCNELLGTFSQLFSHLDLESHNVKATAPSMTTGTIKSTKGSIFSRRKNRNSTFPPSQKLKESISVVSSTPRPSTQATQAPTIQITDEHGKSPRSRRHKIRDSLEKKHDSKVSLEPPKKLVRKSSQRSTRSSTHPAATAEPLTAVHHDDSPEAKQPLPEIPHNTTAHDQMPPPVFHNEQPPQQDVRLPNVHSSTNATSPTTRFSKAAAEKHALAILTKIWLIIAMLYRRASMFEDSKEACEEAAKAVAKIETIVGSIDHSARAFAEAGWGGVGKSVDEVWADVYCERAELQLAIHERKLLDGQDASNNDVRTAAEHFEQCLMLSPDHSLGTVGLSNLLLDFYEKKIELSKDVKATVTLSTGTDGILQRGVSAIPTLTNDVASSETQSITDALPGAFDVPIPTVTISQPNGIPRSAQVSARPSISAADDPRGPKANDNLRKTPENLNRIAARDRAYGLLSHLTKSGAGWDNAEAWYALARAHELGGEIDKAKSILWWCVELEDTRPIRHWRNLEYSLD